MRHISLDPGQEFNTFANFTPTWQGWLATYVVDKNGNFVDESGSSAGLGNKEDLSLLLSLREKADVIVTSGATARAENYRASRFAPITVISNHPESLKAIPLFDTASSESNEIFSSSPASLFLDLTNHLQLKGHERFLFEGGPSLLKVLCNHLGTIEIIINMANLQDPGAIEPKLALDAIAPRLTNATVLDDAVIGSNRVTRWSVTA